MQTYTNRNGELVAVGSINHAKLARLRAAAKKAPVIVDEREPATEPAAPAEPQASEPPAPAKRVAPKSAAKP